MHKGWHATSKHKSSNSCGLDKSEIEREKVWENKEWSLISRRSECNLDYLLCVLVCVWAWIATWRMNNVMQFQLREFFPFGIKKRASLSKLWADFMLFSLFSNGSLTFADENRLAFALEILQTQKILQFSCSTTFMHFHMCYCRWLNAYEKWAYLQKSGNERKNLKVQVNCERWNGNAPKH